MKNSFEWKKDIDDKVAIKRESIMRRNAQLRSISGITLAFLLCLGCSVAVVRFSKINHPPVDTSNDGIMTIPSFSDYTFPTVTSTADDTNNGVMTIPSFPDSTYPYDTGVSAGTTAEDGTDLPYYTAMPPAYTGDDPYPMTGDSGEYQTSHPILTSDDIYPVTTVSDEVIWTTLKDQETGFRFAERIISQAFPEKMVFPNATEYKKTFAMALEYYGLSDLNIPPRLRTDIDYRIDFADNYTFLANDNGGMLGVIVRDDITVNYLSVHPQVYYQLSMGRVTVPYDWVFTTAENSTLEYRDIKIKCGYLNGDGISAELIVADYEYNGIKFRFTGHNAIEKEFISCLYNIIDCLLRR